MRNILKVCSQLYARPRKLLQFSLVWFLAVELRRFYKSASVSEAAGGGYEINLDRKKLKTPMGKLFVVPSEAMAIAVATEWNGQKDIIKRHGMHLVKALSLAQSCFWMYLLSIWRNA